MQTQDTKTERIHKSLKLTPKQVSLFKAKVSEYPSQEVAAEELGFKNRATIANIISKGSGSHHYITLIKKLIA